jgi:repressor LexA
MSQYIKGSFEPKQDRIYKIAEALGVSEAWLMGFDVPMKRNSTNGDSIPNGFQPIPSTSKRPRLGVISCGNPIDTPENFDGYDDVPDMFDCDFTLVCEGDSMMGARICDGDIVYIKQQPTIENGQIAAVLIDGDEKLLKRVYITDESIILQAENPAYPPRSYHREDMNRVSIIGKVVGFTSMVK